MLFSKRCSYAILALAYMSTKPTMMIQLREIANETQLPYHFLCTVMRQLTRAGLLKSAKGKRGGLKLSKDPKICTILEIRNIIDGNEDFEQCFFCHRSCNSPEECPIQMISQPTNILLKRDLDSINLHMVSMVLSRTQALQPAL